MPNSVEFWSYEEVGEWLKQIGLGKYAELFCRHEINGEILLTMTERDMSAPPINVDTFGALRKFGIEIEKLKADYKQRLESLTPSTSVANLPPIVDNVPNVSATETINIAKSVTKSVGTEFLEPVEAHSEETVRAVGNARQFVSEFEFSAIQSSENSATSISNAVMMKGTYMDSVIKMEQLFPAFCWRYQDNTEVIKQTSHNRSILGDAVYVVSPVEFYVQPQFYVKRAIELREEMNKFYSTDFDPVRADHIYENMPCAVQYKDDKLFYRAIVQQKGIEDAHVFFVDWGDGQFVSFDDIKPLTNEFGRFPPLAFRCRIEGVRERTLVQKIVAKFKEEINNLTNSVIKFNIVSYCDNVVTIRLYHPVTNENIGQKYATTDPLVPEFDKPTKQNDEEEVDSKNNFASFDELMSLRIYEQDQILQQMKAKQEKASKGGYINELEMIMDGAPVGVPIGDDDDDDDDDDRKPSKVQAKKTDSGTAAASSVCLTYSDENCVKYLKSYPKQVKPPKGSINVEIVKVVSAREIYIRSDIQSQCLNQLIKPMLKTLVESSECKPLADNMIIKDVACCYHVSSTGDLLRARLGEVNSVRDQRFPVILIDYGELVLVQSSERRRRLKALPADGVLQNEPQLYKCKLNQLCIRPPTDVETTLLKEMLPVGAHFIGTFDRSREPYTIHLVDPDNRLPFEELFENEIVKRNLNEKAAYQRKTLMDVAVYTPSVYNSEKFAEISTSCKGGDNGAAAAAICQPTSIAADSSSWMPGFSRSDQRPPTPEREPATEGDEDDDDVDVKVIDDDVED